MVKLRRWEQKKDEYEDEEGNVAELPPKLVKRKVFTLVDLLEDVPEQDKRSISSIFKYDVAQWLLHDLIMESEFETGELFQNVLQQEDVVADVDMLRVAHAEGTPGLTLAEDWSWDLITQPAQGVHGDLSAASSVAKQAKKVGTEAFKKGRLEEALASFSKGLRALQGLEVALRDSGPVATLRLDLLKGKALVADRLKMPHVELRTAETALLLSPNDPKAWYRKAHALDSLGQTGPAQEALQRSGLPSLTPEKGSLVAEKSAPKESSKRKSKFALSKREYEELKDMILIESGLDSIRAIRFRELLSAETHGRAIPASLVFLSPTFGEVVEEINAQMSFSGHKSDTDEELLLRSADVTWRSLCTTLGSDPRKTAAGKDPPRRLSMEEAGNLVGHLEKAYSNDTYRKKTAAVAKEAGFDLRPFLIRMRPVALEVQGPVLVSMGFPATDEGMQRAEAAIVAHARCDDALLEKVNKCREAAYGGENGLWTVFMEHDDRVQGDEAGMEARAQFLHMSKPA